MPQAVRSTVMGRLDTSKAGELRMLAEKLRRSADEMSLASYVEKMRRTAADLDAEADTLDEERIIIVPGQLLNITV